MRNEVLFRARGLIVGLINDMDLGTSLDVYKNSEDFLSLGPVSKASMEMLLADIDYSKSAHGLFCGIWDSTGRQIGVLDFIPESKLGTAFLTLLMISRAFRNKGFGSKIIGSLESYLQKTYQTKYIESGVQTNNVEGIRFWKSSGFLLDKVGKPMGDGTVAYKMRKVLS